MEYSMNKTIRQRMGNRDDIMAPHGVYRCKGEDDWVAIAVSTNEEWEFLCEAIGKPRLAQDERFGQNLSRRKNQDALDKLIEEWTINYTKYEVTEILQRGGVAAGPILTSNDLLNDPQILANDYITDYDHPVWGRIKVPGIPIHLQKTPGQLRMPAPELGQHTEEVLIDILGYTWEQIAELRDKEVF